MTSSTLITIQEAADLSGKSLQTIRRAIKQKKLSAKRKKTAQGFQYFITRESVTAFYKLKIDTASRQAGGIKHHSQALSTENYAPLQDFEELKKAFDQLLSQKDREDKQLYDLLKALQEKFVVMENQLKLLQEPASRKRWYQFWR